MSLRIMSSLVTVAIVTGALAATSANAAKSKKVAALPANSVTAKQIKKGAVTAPKLAKAAVTSLAIKDGTITLADIAPGVIPSLPNIPAATSPFIGALAGGSLTGTFPNPTIAANIVTSAMLVDGAITTADLSSGSITSSLIADGTIGAADLAPGAVTSAAIFGKAVGTGQLADGAVTASQLADNSVSGATIVNGSVSGTDLDSDSITTIKLVDDAITTDKLATASVETSKLADEAVTAGKLADGAVGAAAINLPSVGAGIAAASQNFPDSIFYTTLLLDEERWKTSNTMHSTSVSPDRLIAPSTGIYRVSANLVWYGSSTGQRMIRALEASTGFTIAGSTTPGASNDTLQSISGEVCLDAGEYVNFAATSSGTGGSALLDGDQSTFGMSLVTTTSSC